MGPDWKFQLQGRLIFTSHFESMLPIPEERTKTMVADSFPVAGICSCHFLLLLPWWNRKQSGQEVVPGLNRSKSTPSITHFLQFWRFQPPSKTALSAEAQEFKHRTSHIQAREQEPRIYKTFHSMTVSSWGKDKPEDDSWCPILVELAWDQNKPSWSSKKAI